MIAGGRARADTSGTTGRSNHVGVAPGAPATLLGFLEAVVLEQAHQLPPCLLTVIAPNGERFTGYLRPGWCRLLDDPTIGDDVAGVHV